MAADMAGREPAVIDKVAWIDLSAFGEPTVVGPRKMRQNLPIIASGIVAVIVAFVALVFLWYLVSQISPQVEESFGSIFVIVVLLACIYAIYRSVTLRTGWDSGLGHLISERDFPKRELGKAVPHAGMTLQALLVRTRAIAASFGPAVRPRETDPTKLNRARWMRIAGFAVAAVGALVFLFVSVAAGTAVIMGSSLLFVRAVQAAQPGLATVRAQDPRRPILLLRSFRDDKLTAPQRFRYWIWRYTTVRRFEQAIAGSFREFGPMIAIGEPGEKLPQLGAARIYLSSDDWQGAVLGWIDESLLIVMIAGTTQWITWELHRILEKGRFHHLLIMLPPEPQKLKWTSKQISSRAERWANVLAAFAGTPWSPALASLDISELLLVQLDPDGKVVAIKSSNTFVQDYALAVAVAINDEFSSLVETP